MRCFAAIVLIALTTAGCVGFSDGSGSTPSSDRHLAVPWPKTVLTVSYYAKRCPPGARCPLQVKSLGNVRFVRVVLGTKNWVCGCAQGVHPGDKAVGFYNGKRRTIPLDGCSLCNLSGIGGDINLLMPGHARI
jgi:hypothetical protein